MPYTFNPLTGNFDYYTTGGTGPTGLTGPAGYTIPGMDGEDGQDGQTIIGPAGLAALPGSTAFGEMIINNNVTGQVITTQNVWYQVTAGWATGDLNSFSYAGGVLTSNVSGSFFTTCTVSINSTSSNQVYHFQIYQNGISITGHDATLKLTNSSDINSLTIAGMRAVVNVGDVFTLYVQNTTSSGQTIVISDANFSMFAVAGATGKMGMPGFDGQDGEDGYQTIMQGSGGGTSNVAQYNVLTLVSLRV